MQPKSDEEKSEVSVSTRRPLTGYRAKIVAAIAVIASLYHIIVLSNVLDYLFDWNITYITHRSISLSFFVVLAFLVVPMWKRDLKDKLPWYDIILALLGFAGCAYIFILNEKVLILRFTELTTLDVVFGVITVAVLLEATRRVVGWFIPLLVLFFVCMAIFGEYFPGFLHNRGYSPERLLLDSYIRDAGIWSSLLEIAATMIFMFILFAAFLRVSGADKFFLNFAMALAGRFRGGPAKVAIIGSAFFGSISGSAVANVAGTGMITIPLMKKTGYRPHVAGAIEAVASTGGMIMPPVMGAAAFIMAEWLGVSYWTVVVAALLPSLLYYVSLYFMVDFEAARTGLKGLPTSELPSLRKTIAQGWVFVIPIIVLVYFIGVLKWSPTVAALYSIITLVLVSLLRKETRLNLRKFLGGLEAGSKGMIEVAVLCATIGIMIGIIYTTGLGVRLSGILVDLSGGHLPVLLILTALASYVLGMGLPTTACYILLASLVAPALIQMNVTPIAAHMFVLYWGTLANITPPVCGAVFVGAAISGSKMMRTGLEAMRLAIVAYMVPFLFVYSPELVAVGSVAQIAVAALTGLIGVSFLASGIQGYMFRPLHWAERVLLVVGSVLMIIPGWITDLAGIGVIGVVVARQVYLLLASRPKVALSTVEQKEP